jgi:hypothetical protein
VAMIQSQDVFYVANTKVVLSGFWAMLYKWKYM